jgi:hypothetical protein
MFSKLHPVRIYTDISPDVVLHDEEYEAEEWVYDNRKVFRGSEDPSYEDTKVYSLYDENLTRVGLAEHSIEDPSIFHALWFYSNPFATLLQEPDWTSTEKTLWSTLTPEAYQDLLENDFKDVLLKGAGRIVTPEYVMRGFPDAYQCEQCGRRSFSLQTSCHAMKKITPASSLYFLDDLFVLYSPPKNSSILVRLGLQRDDGVPSLPAVPVQEDSHVLLQHVPPHPAAVHESPPQSLPLPPP